MSDNTWIQELKVGDVVYVSKNYGRLPERATVTRITPTQVVVSLGGVIDPNGRYERKHRRSDGRSVGADSWHVQYLIQATPEIEAKHRLHNMNFIASKRLGELSTVTFTEQEAQDVIDFCAAMKDRLDARLQEASGNGC